MTKVLKNWIKAVPFTLLRLPQRLNFSHKNFFHKNFPHRLSKGISSILSSPPFAACSYLLILLFCFSLTGCSFFNPGPSTAVVEKALAQKLVYTQELLRSQLADEAITTNPFSVGRVKVSAKHNVTLDRQSALEVEGTYTLKGGDLSRSQRQQSRPFDIYLQRGPEKDQWLLLEPRLTPGAAQRGWQAIPLGS